jgi:hypothetical protein
VNEIYPNEYKNNINYGGFDSVFPLFLVCYSFHMFHHWLFCVCLVKGRNLLVLQIKHILSKCFCKDVNWDVAGITLGTDWTTKGSSFSIFHVVQIESGANPASYPLGTDGSLLGGKAAGAWSWPLTPRSAQVKKTWIYTSTPPHVFIA